MTALAGTSSRVDGSEGGGPSRAHRLDSYFERMNESSLLKPSSGKLRSETQRKLTVPGAYAQV